MHWNKKPDKTELGEIGESVNRGISTVRIVMQKILDACLLTSDYGSVPLYRYNETIRHNLSMVEQIDENPPNEDEKFNDEPTGVNPIELPVQPRALR